MGPRFTKSHEAGGGACVGAPGGAPGEPRSLLAFRSGTGPSRADQGVRPTNGATGHWPGGTVSAKNARKNQG